MADWLIPIFVGLVILAAFAVLHWYFEVYTPRKHMREAIAETDALFDLTYGPGWRERAKRGHIPPRAAGVLGTPADQPKGGA